MLQEADCNVDFKVYELGHHGLIIPNDTESIDYMFHRIIQSTL
jgi:hypothetical protein